MSNQTNKPNTPNTAADRNTTESRNTTGQQSGTKREGAENTQATTPQQPGTQRKGAENTQGGRDGSEHQPGTQRKGAENTQGSNGGRPAGTRDTDARGTLGDVNADPLASDDENNVETDTDLDQVETGKDDTVNAAQKDKANTASGARK